MILLQLHNKKKKKKTELSVFAN